MTVRPYEPKDFPTVKAWGESWGADYDESQFPKTGFVVEGIAAYFLYSTDSSVCWLENLVTSRMAKREDKDLAVKMLIDEGLRVAKEKGFRVAYATTDLITAAKRAKAAGATVHAFQYLLTKDLTAK